ncbi:MAG TPA: N-acetyl-D-Glu racemase DgcA, partial [Rhodospirillales bacterium]|nr:N-acetyl-D-Glu racemase DgcA [Rhodospirillales bacterium]
RRLTVRHQTWPLARPFAIARGTKTAAEVVVAEIEDDGRIGRGEGVPYARYGETVEAVLAATQAMAGAIARGMDREALQAALPAGAARNALDCALWDVEAKRAGVRAWELAGTAPPRPLPTATTLSLDTAARMAGAAAEAVADGVCLLKLKVGADAVVERVAAVRAAAPETRLIVDANEGWTFPMLQRLAEPLHALGVEMIEQPLPAGSDGALAGFVSPVPICADESFHTQADLDRLDGYRMVNVKLDKTGGLTAALPLAGAARARGLALMVGCMVSTSLAMAPATLLGQGAALVDLDGPQFLARDREHGLRYDGGLVYPPEPALWG